MYLMLLLVTHLRITSILLKITPIFRSIVTTCCGPNCLLDPWFNLSGDLEVPRNPRTSFISASMDTASDFAASDDKLDCFEFPALRSVSSEPAYFVSSALGTMTRFKSHCFSKLEITEPCSNECKIHNSNYI